jgi:precorrin-6B methylase 1
VKTESHGSQEKRDSRVAFSKLGDPFFFGSGIFEKREKIVPITRSLKNQSSIQLVIW